MSFSSGLANYSGITSQSLGLLQQQGTQQQYGDNLSMSVYTCGTLKKTFVQELQEEIDGWLE